ncbi:MAG: glutamyl-tRNA amidotransferase, partial [Verrucomicrobiaceae bacterium]|nr:glutamyl-tRNA amidotransferase [Verrucomicrobiaceae bacterium]
MSLSEKITSDIKDAMRAKDSTKLAVLRSLKTALTNYTIEKYGADGELEASEDIGVVRTAIKQRQDSIEKFEAAGRNELAEQEKLEADILEEYLPTAMTEDEISKLIEDTIQEVGASSRKDMGQVMKLLQNKTQGRVDN